MKQEKRGFLAVDRGNDDAEQSTESLKEQSIDLQEGIECSGEQQVVHSPSRERDQLRLGALFACPYLCRLRHDLRGYLSC